MTSSIAIVMPIHNGEAWIENAFSHILTQSIQPRQWIIIDDASTDSTRLRIESLNKKHPWIEPLYLKENIGVNKAIQRGLKLVQSPYVIFSAVDDLLLPGFFEKMELALQVKPDCPALACQNIFYYDYSDWAWSELPHLSEKIQWISPNEIVDALKKNIFNIGGNSVVYNKKRLESLGGFQPNLGPIADTFSFLNLIFSDGLCYIPEPLTLCRLRNKSYSATCVSDKGKSKKIAKSFLQAIQLSPPEIQSRFSESAFLSRASLTILKTFSDADRLHPFKNKTFYKNLLKNRFLFLSKK